jgi:hypothetical protein
MREENARLLDAWVHGDRPVTELISAAYTFVNDRLAAHYGLPAGGDWRRVEMASTQRRGILGEGAVLTMTSHADRTSPTGRGAWVLDQVMCSRLPEPPPGVPPLPTAAQGQETLKQRLARHRTDPTCATCHALMDPIGLGLENFDAVGASRTVENGVPIDPSGELPGGVKFSGAVELAGLMVADARFASCVTRRLLTFIVGRTFDGPDDDEWISRITKDGQSSGGSFKSVLLAIASSAAFRSRGAEGSAP